MIFLLIMMGGTGTRVGKEIPKQYIEIGNKPIFQYILEKYLEIKEISGIVLVSHRDWITYVEDKCSQTNGKERIKVVQGGENRSQSVKNGLAALQENAEEEDIVLIHDATHPYVDFDGTRAVIAAAMKYGGATLAAFQYDTCYQMDDKHMIKEVVPRKNIVSGASPEAFRLKILWTIYQNSTDSELVSMTSAGAIALAHGIPMKVIEAKQLNLKITYESDLELFSILRQSYFFGENENK